MVRRQQNRAAQDWVERRKNSRSSWKMCNLMLTNTVAKRLRMRQVEHFQSLFQSHFPVRSKSPRTVGFILCVHAARVFDYSVVIASLCIVVLIFSSKISQSSCLKADSSFIWKMTTHNRFVVLFTSEFYRVLKWNSSELIAMKHPGSKLTTLSICLFILRIREWKLVLS